MTDPLARVACDLDPGQPTATPTPETKAMPASAAETAETGGQVVELFTTDQQGRPWNSSADFGPIYVVILFVALFLVVRGCSTAEDDPTGGSTAPSTSSPATTTTPWCPPGWAPHPDDPGHCHPEEWRDKPLPEGTRGSIFDREPRDPWGTSPSSTADPWSNVPDDQLPRPEDFPDETGPYFPTETETNSF